MSNNLRNSFSFPPERRTPSRWLGTSQVIRAGSGNRRSVVRLRRVRSDYAEKFFLGAGPVAATEKPLSRIITF
jgi:hypothetical protein